MKQDILKMLEKNARLSSYDIAAMVGIDAKEVEKL